MYSLFNAIRRIGFTRGPNRILAGICGGMAARIGIPVSLVRVGLLLAMVVLTIPLPVYLVGWLLLPWRDGSIALERMLGSGIQDG
ncbi:MAG: PspC domain-containing protein [Beutenbergiaceae bacterium]